MPPTPSLEPLGDAALLARAPSASEANGWRAACLANPFPGVLDACVAFQTVAVLFDPGAVRKASGGQRAPFETVRDWFRSKVARGRLPDVAPQTIDLPVCFDPDLAPDAEAVASHSGQSLDEVAELLASAELSVGAIGFTPGFAYLTGVPVALHISRRAQPRTRVEPGSFALGGAYAGVYPTASPGGWSVVGRTPIEVFDPHRVVPAIWSVGDLVRVRPIDRAEFDRLAITPSPNSLAPAANTDEPLFRVDSAGMQTTLQDAPRTQVASLGVSPGGPADRFSHRLANALVGNDGDRIAVEATLVGPELVALRSLTVGIAGASPRGATSPQRRTLASGERLDLRSLAGGARCYVAVHGGFAGDRVLRGAGADLRGKFGGYFGRALMKGDILYAGADTGPLLPDLALSSRLHPRSGAGTATLRVMKGPEARLFPPGAWEMLLQSTFTVGQASDRMGVRCFGAKIAPPEAATRESGPVVTGAIQVPPGGAPIVLGPDRATIGGYPVIGCVVSADWPLLAQLVPGERLGFEEVSLLEAERISIASERAAAVAAWGIRLIVPPASPLRAAQ